jgi:hypothetical protein
VQFIQIVLEALRAQIVSHLSLRQLASRPTV